ncbi:hypothetical protein Tdes44962_MAKER02761 [Teratosphaeria destructans]|uniref:Uncharacterized protein n=1 Tax=Teratosphaeria destructans TaxID=418781 RepID=A0A9W7W2G4_9PEZI|nr:hypothetical protein Tdes44962_MAKER02761 [Teratosphaeria destructans]
MTRDAALRLSSGRGPAIRRPRARSIFEGLRGGLGSHRAGPSNDPWPAAASQKKAPDNIAIKHEDLYITQPPICAMQGFLYPRSSLLDSAHASGGVRDEEESSACAKLSCDTGITLGFLADSALSILPTPSLSSRLTFKEMNERERGEEQIVFKAIMSFTDEHTKERRRGGNKEFILLGK